MIKDIERVVSASETKLHYHNKETMTGLYFKEMLSKINNSEDKENNYKDHKKENHHKEDKNQNSNKNNDVEGTLLDKLC